MPNTLTARLKARSQQEEADVVQTVILISGFVIVCIVFVVWISQAAVNKGADTASCVETVRAPSYTGTDNSTEDNCKAVSHASDHSFTSSSEYQQRY